MEEKIRCPYCGSEEVHALELTGCEIFFDKGYGTVIYFYDCENCEESFYVDYTFDLDNTEIEVMK